MWGFYSWNWYAYNMPDFYYPDKIERRLASIRLSRFKSANPKPQIMRLGQRL